jgi:hypothetical protein
LDEAVGVFARHPRHRDSLIALASFERERLVEAERLAAAAAALDPADRRVPVLLQQIRTMLQLPRP